MRIAIISDIHANLEALTVCLSLIKSLDVDRLVCLGDIVGYGPDPDACVVAVRETADVVLLGNHDHAAVNIEATRNFNPLAKEAVLWTRERLSSESLAFLQKRPLSHEEQDILFVHSTPYRPEEWHYIFSWNEAIPQFEYFEQEVCFIGHSHLPQIYHNDVSKPLTLKLNAGMRYIINVGSVGQPRDGDPRLSFGVFDTDTHEYLPIRAEYDVEATANKVLAGGLPQFLAERLLKGR